MAQLIGEAQWVSLVLTLNSNVSLLILEARRLNKQIFLSVDVPTSFGNPGQSTHFLIYVEKLLVKSLVDFERSQLSSDP